MVIRKMTNNHLQHTMQLAKEWATRNPT